MTPVPDAGVLDLLLDELAYDTKPVDAQHVEESKEDTRWRTERITLNTGHGDERFEVLLIIPHDVPPPWQVVVYSPGAGALFESRVTGADAATDPRFVTTGGRVVIYPEWYGTFSRQVPGQRSPTEDARERSRDITLRNRAELGRILDFVESRDDVDEGRVAFMAASQGGDMLSITVTEDRLKALIILSWAPANFEPWWHPVADYFTLASRAKHPTLLVAGLQDPFYTYEDQQVPFVDRLGTPNEHIRHVAFEGVGHAPLPLAAKQREVTDFLDRYLGSVQSL